MELDKDPKTSLRIDVIEGEDGERQLNALLSKCFPVPDGGSFFDDFPVWRAEHAANIIRIGVYDVAKEKALVASAAARLATLQLRCGPLPVVIVGAVATDPDYRKRGLASALVSHLDEWARAREVPFMVLWGSEHEMYRKLGFELCGLQTVTPLQKLLPNDIARPEKVGRGWDPRIGEYLQKRRGGLFVEERDLKWFEAHKNVQWFWTEAAGKIEAYAALGRGMDLPNLVHEWGGEKEKVLALLKEIYQRHENAALLANPRLAEDLGFSEKESFQYLCMGKMLNPEQSLPKILGSAGFLDDVSAKQRGGNWKVQIGDQKFPPLSQGNLSKLVFGPETVEGFSHPELPVELWFWGLDAG